MSCAVARRALLKGMGAMAIMAGGIAGGLGADARALVGGERGAEVEGAGGRLRLSHAYLRPPFSRRAECEVAAAGCDGRRLSSVAEATGLGAQCGGHAVDLRHGQFRHARRHRETRRRGPGRRRRRCQRQRRRAEAARRPRHHRHPLNLVQSGATTIEMLEPLSKRVDALGWHVQIHMLGDQILQTQNLLQRLPTRIVFDHLARIPQPAGVDHPAFAFVRKLIDKGRTWVKLSSAYQDSKAGPPAYADVSEVAQAYVKAAPERMVWGSDWPHPTEKTDAKPDDAILFDLLADWAPDEAVRNRILVDNPAALYRFGRAG
jgi:hypothetical protein